MADPIFVDAPAPSPVTHGPGSAHLDPTQPQFVDAPAPGPGTGDLKQVEGNPLNEMSEDDLIKRFGGDPAQVKKQPNYTPGMFTKSANEDWGHLDRLAYGYSDIVKGLGQIGNKLGLGDAQDPMKILQNLHDYRYDQEKPQGTDVMRGIGNALGVASTVPTAPGVTGALLTGAGAGLVQPVKDENSPDFWTQKLGQAGTGAATSGYLHSLFNPMVNAAGSAINAGLQKGANWVEQHTPQGVRSELLKKMANTPFSGTEDLDAAIAKGSGPRFEAATKLKAELAKFDTGELAQTPGNVAQKSMQLESIKARLNTDAGYAKVSEMIGNASLHPDPSGPISAINKIIANESGPNASMIPDEQRSKLVGQLQILRDNLAKGDQPYEAFHNTRTVLGDMLDTYFKGTNGVIGKTGSQYISEIDHALGQAMTDSVKATGNHALIAAQGAADAAYSKMAGTFRDPEIVKAMGSDNPSSIISALSRSGGPNTRIDQEQRLWNALDPKGRLAGMAGMADFAMRKMQLKGNNDPMDFLSGMKDQTDAFHVFFHGDEATRMKGLINTVQVIDKLSKALGPVEGAAAGALGGGEVAGHFSPIAGGIGAVGGAVLGAKELGGYGTKLTGDALKWLLTSPQSAEFLRKTASMPPGSSYAAQFITRQLPKVMAGFAAKQRFDQSMNTEQPSPMSLPSVESLK